MDYLDDLRIYIIPRAWIKIIMKNIKSKRLTVVGILLITLIISLTQQNVTALNPEIEYVIIINIDALRADVLSNSLDNMPNMLKLVNHSVYYDNAITVFPSITMAAQASIFTGSSPSSHRIAGHNWFDKTTQEYRSYSVGVWYEDIIWSEGQANEDLSSNVETIYEAAYNSNLDSTVVFNQYSRLNEGTTRWIKPGPIELFYAKVTKEYHKIDINSMSHSLNELNKFPNSPDILTIYMPGNDENSHDKGPSDQSNYIRTYTDVEIGKLINKLKNIGIYNKTLIVITSDHGQTKVTKDNEHSINRDELEEVLESDQSLSALNYTTSFGNNCFQKCTLCIGTPTCNLVPVCRCAVAAPNGGMAQIYVSQFGGLWNIPSKEEVLAVASVFYNKSYIDKVLVRYSGSNEYKLYDGDNTPEDISSLNSDKYPDAVERINGLDSTRSGDIILIANYDGGYQFSDEPTLGTHGSLYREDSYVPLIFSWPGFGQCNLSTARNIDIAPTIAGLMGFSIGSVDGYALFNKNYCPRGTCTDGIKNNDETDIDCGGPCGKCNNNKSCSSSSDCQSNYCSPNKICTIPTCNDGILNGDEKGVDCFGSCSPCNSTVFVNATIHNIGKANASYVNVTRIYIFVFI